MPDRTSCDVPLLSEALTRKQPSSRDMPAPALTARGWHVFPCAPGGKQPALHGNWQERATADADQVRAWWGAGHLQHRDRLRVIRHPRHRPRHPASRGARRPPGRRQARHGRASRPVRPARAALPGSRLHRRHPLRRLPPVLRHARWPGPELRRPPRTAHRHPRRRPLRHREGQQHRRATVHRTRRAHARPPAGMDRRPAAERPAGGNREAGTSAARRARNGLRDGGTERGNPPGRHRPARHAQRHPQPGSVQPRPARGHRNAAVTSHRHRAHQRCRAFRAATWPRSPRRRRSSPSSSSTAGSVRYTVSCPPLSPSHATASRRSSSRQRTTLRPARCQA